MATLLAVALCGGCGSIQVRKTTNVLDYLYPEGTPAIPARDVTLTLPLRVGLAFAPAGRERTSSSNVFLAGADSPVTEMHKQVLLQRIADAFRGRDSIASVDPIPSAYLQAGGSFANLDQIAASMGVDVVVLLSYDQAQFNETSDWSLTYWTIVGAYIVEGENNQTQTFLDAAVYDIKSRALLFRTAGSDVRGGESTPIETAEALRKASEDSLLAATDDLITKLDAALKEFGRQAVGGTVHGQGTPALDIKPSSEYHGVARFEGGRYAGAAGLGELVLLGLLAAAAWMTRRAA